MTETELSKRPRGRPRDPAKREAILAAARRLFLEHGPDAVPLDAVIAEAGISKDNFYANFADRGSLLEAVIMQESDRIIGTSAEAEMTNSIEDTLIAFGENLLVLLADPDVVGFERLIAAAAGAHPELPGRFFEAGPGRARRRLAEIIATGAENGRLSVADPEQAAEDLVGLWQGMLRVELTMRFSSTPERALLRSRAERGVTQFMRLYGRTV